MNWVHACKGETQASSPFEYGTQLNETMVLGVAAMKSGAGKKLYYDAEKMQFSNAPDANKFLTREYRSGWELEPLPKHSEPAEALPLRPRRDGDALRPAAKLETGCSSRPSSSPHPPRRRRRRTTGSQTEFSRPAALRTSAESGRFGSAHLFHIAEPHNAQQVVDVVAKPQLFAIQRKLPARASTCPCMGQACFRQRAQLDAPRHLARLEIDDDEAKQVGECGVERFAVGRGLERPHTCVCRDQVLHTLRRRVDHNDCIAELRPDVDEPSAPV